VGEILRWLVLTIQYHLAPRLWEDYSYNFSPFLVNYGLFYFEPYLLATRSTRRR
jgi:hypothetical protein